GRTRGDQGARGAEAPRRALRRAQRHVARRDGELHAPGSGALGDGDSLGERPGRVKPKVAIATGDPAGIGPEISIKAARDPRVTAICQPVLFGSREVLAMHWDITGLSIVEVPQARPRIG